MKKEKVLKSVIAALTMLVVAPKVIGCPTCVGRLRLGVRKPFFEQYKPKPINKKLYATKTAKDGEILRKVESDPESFWIRLRKQLKRQEKFFRKRRKL